MLAKESTGQARQRAVELLEQLRGDKFVAAYPPLVAMEARDFGNAESMKRAVDLLKEAFQSDQDTGLNAFRWLPPNPRVAVVQTSLGSEKLYRGRVNGLLTRSTLASIARFCESAGIAKQCRAEALPDALLEKLLQRPDA
jgi:hypothetical protein